MDRDNIKIQLENIEKNSANLAELNRRNYINLSTHIKYFKIPIIFFSSANSIFSVSLNSYMTQPSVSLLTCLISFLVSLISSIELYLGINKRLDNALLCYRNFYTLSIKIKQSLLLDTYKEEFLQQCTEEYKTYFQDSEVTNYIFKDTLISPHYIVEENWYSKFQPIFTHTTTRSPHSKITTHIPLTRLSPHTQNNTTHTTLEMNEITNQVNNSLS